MNLVIDGYNLMHKLAVKGESLEQKRNKLVALVNEFCEENKNKALMVFDAHRTESLYKTREKAGRVSIIYTPKNETADDVIISILDEKKPKNNMLISSDNRIRRQAAEKNFHLMRSEEFAEYL